MVDRQLIDNDNSSTGLKRTTFIGEWRKTEISEREREDKGDKQKKEIERGRIKTEIIKTGKEIIRKDK